MAGAAPLADLVGVVAPADLAGTDVPAVAGMKFLAIAEVYSSAVDDEGAPLVIRDGKQWGAAVEVDPVWAGGECHHRLDGMTVPEPLEHSVVGVPIEVGNSYVDRVTMSNPIELSGVRETADPPSDSQLLMHSEVSGDWEISRMVGRTIRVTIVHPWRFRQKTSGSRRMMARPYVVGAVGSAAPWFLTGWAGEVEIEFMIDTGCQVTILATSVFERMCTSDPQVRSRLRPCGRRMVSADSSPFDCKGEFEVTVVFLGLSCDMLLVVASIGSDGLLGTEALQSCLPHQLDLRTGQLWAEGRSTLQLLQQRLTPRVRAFLNTSVVLPQDREIVAPVSVWSGSGVRPGPWLMLLHGQPVS